MLRSSNTSARTIRRPPGIWEHSLIAKLRRLESFPRLGRIVPEFQIETLREIVNKPYRIVYQINDSKAAIEVARFWHSARGTPELRD